MTQAAKSQEPSMEEILASIRRIIADDDAKPSPAAPPTPPPPAAPPAPAPRIAAPPPPPVVPPPPPSPPRIDPSALLKQAAMRQGDIDMMLKDDVIAPSNAIAEEPDDVLDLTESMVAPPPPPVAPATASFQTIHGEPDVVFREPDPFVPPPRIPEPPRPAQQSAPERSLLSNTTSAAVDSAFNTLAQTVLVQNARTLEDLVREMLRPLLKGWLDDNLPGIVERLVKAEIDRVARGRT